MSSPFGPAADHTSGITRAIRPNCSQCGASIRWGRAVDLPAIVPPEERVAAGEMSEFAGPEGEYWRCTRCGHFGVFGPVESSVPTHGHDAQPM